MPVRCFFFYASPSHMARFSSATIIGNNLQRTAPEYPEIVTYIQPWRAGSFKEFEEDYFLTEKKGASFACY
ncbi:hypothetical protein ALP32_103665 [Pseudomonas avellanae]|uniref:Uncharacterized protein n=2 Tax=Pseudomonas avellanae TaxID=46257 RepID=A0A3M5T913_9PSED|nr:hypothetical protein ALP32_103665 [Pseudomonas avellanae]